MTWRKREPDQEGEGYAKGSGIQPDRKAADGCRECRGVGYLVCAQAHIVVAKQVHAITGEERIISRTRETCFGHLCMACQPVSKLVEEKLRA